MDGDVTESAVAVRDARACAHRMGWREPVRLVELITKILPCWMNGSMPFRCKRSMCGARRRCQRIMRSAGNVVDECGDGCAYWYPEQQIPVEEREAAELRVHLIVEGNPQCRDEGDEEQQIPELFSSASIGRAVLHAVDPFRALDGPGG